MKKLLLLATLLLISVAASALEIPIKRDSAKKTSYTLLLTGRIDAAFYSDSYQSIEQRNGLQYYMPMRPNYDPLTGEDLNAVGQLRFNAASTRLGVGARIIFDHKVSIDALVETDFMGASANLIQSLRLRHAYFRLNIGRTSLLFGQTNHLAVVDEIAPPTITFGSGFPVNLLSRPVQIQFSQKIGRLVNISAALSMFINDQYTMQAWAMTPDISIRATVGDAKRNMIGVAAGFKSITPKLLDYVKDPKARLNTFYASIFGRVTLGKGYALRAYAIYGGDLTTLGLSGGFAPLLDHSGYAPLNVVSAWVDFATPRFAGFEFGVFAGYQQNMGTYTDIDCAGIYGGSMTRGLQNFWRVAPRVWYHFKMLSFGLEYMYSQAVWAHQWDARYQSSFDMPASRNNRYTLLARFTF